MIDRLKMPGLECMMLSRAPEQADSAFGRRGPHTDVWGFAACVLHLATGQLPYAGLTPLQVLFAFSKRQPPNVPDTLPTWLGQSLQQCLSCNPIARPSVALVYKV